MSASVVPSSVSCPFATPGRFTAGTTAPETMWNCSRPASWHAASESPPEAPRVSPKPYARSRTTRPPTVNRPASAIPLTETCAASETRRVVRLRAASCATPASLPLRAGAAEAKGRSRGEFFGPDVAGDAPVHLVGLMRKRRPAAPFTSQQPCRGSPEKARSELLPAPKRWTVGLSSVIRKSARNQKLNGWD